MLKSYVLIKKSQILTNTLPRRIDIKVYNFMYKGLNTILIHTALNPIINFSEYGVFKNSRNVYTQDVYTSDVYTQR